MNGYNLLRDWYNFKFSNPSKTKAIHSDMYCYIIDLWNRLGQKDEFGLPTSVTMEALGIGSYNTYKKTIQDLIDFGFVILISESKNQHQSKIVALSKNDKATDEATDKALDKAHIKATDTIIKQVNKEQIKIDYLALLEYVNKTFDRKFKLISDKVKRQYSARLKEGYTKEDIITAINNCKQNKFHIENNYQYCTPEFFSRADNLEKYSGVTKQEKKIEAFHPIIFD